MEFPAERNLSRFPDCGQTTAKSDVLTDCAGRAALS